MSFLIDPSLYAYATPPNVCPACYAAGKSPASVFCNLSGIETGFAWVPGNDPPPNGVYELPASAPCTWSAVFGNWTFTYENVAPNASITIMHAVMGLGFFDIVVPVCSLWFTNQQLEPPILKWCKGQCVVFAPLVGGAFSMEGLANLIVMDLSNPTYATPRPKPNQESVTTLSRRSDSTNLHVKFDHS